MPITMCMLGHYAGSILVEVTEIFNRFNLSSRNRALGSTQPLREMRTGNLPGGKGRSSRKAGNLTAICDPIVYKMWEPLRLAALWASTAYYRDSFISNYVYVRLTFHT
jgi:hypothetical protein